MYLSATLLCDHNGPKGLSALQEFLLVSRLGHDTNVVLHLVPQILNGIYIWALRWSLQLCELTGFEKCLCGLWHAYDKEHCPAGTCHLVVDPEERVASEYAVPPGKLHYSLNSSKCRCSWLPSSKPIPWLCKGALPKVFVFDAEPIFW